MVFSVGRPVGFLFPSRCLISFTERLRILMSVWVLICTAVCNLVWERGFVPRQLPISPKVVLTAMATRQAPDLVGFGGWTGCV